MKDRNVMKDAKDIILLFQPGWIQSITNVKQNRLQ